MWSLLPAIVVVGLIVKGVYYVFFHPLARVPGPYLCKISGIPSAYHAYRGDHHIWLWKMSKRYGPKIRPRPDTVIFSGPEAFNEIYNPKANVKKAPMYETWIRTGDTPHTVTTTDPKSHAKKRRILNLSFTENSLRAAAGFVVKHIDRWNELMGQIPVDGEGWSDVQDMAAWCDNLVFDIMGDLSFGKSFDIKEPGENAFKNMPGNIHAYMSFFYPISRMPFHNVLLWLKPLGLDRLLAALSGPEPQAYLEFVTTSVKERIKKQEVQSEKAEVDQRHDMFYFLHEARDPDTGERAYDEAALQAESELLVVAGSDTTAIILSSCVFYLTHNQVSYDKLVSEIRHNFRSAEEIVQGSTLQNCQYLRACIEGALRISPVALSELPREILRGGMKVQGEHYPEGVNVGVAGWTSSRDDGLYGDSSTFRPERWIPSDKTGVTRGDVSRLRKSYPPFSQGPYSCVGKNLAMLEMMLTLARTLYRFDLRSVPSSKADEDGTHGGGRACDDDQFRMEDFFVAVRYGPMVQFRKRIV